MNKSNPENLPSLKLTKNRWGWAIKLTDIGYTEENADEWCDIVPLADTDQDGCVWFVAHAVVCFDN